jgi:hypothetical protein
MGLGSGIWKKTYSGSRIRVQGSKRYRIPDPDPQHCLLLFVGKGFAEELARRGLNVVLVSRTLDKLQVRHKHGYLQKMFKGTSSQYKFITFR